VAILIWFAANSKSSEVNKALGVANGFSGIFIAMIIFLLIFFVCGCGIFLVNCNMSCKMQLTKLPFTIWTCFVIVVFMAVGGALFSVDSVASGILNDVCNGTSTSGKSSKESALETFFKGVYTTSNSFYCTSTCACNLTYPFNFSDPAYSGLVKSATSKVNNVQWCGTYLDSMYSSLNLTDLWGNNTV